MHKAEANIAKSFNKKEVVDDVEPPQRITKIDFGVHSGDEVVSMSVVEVMRSDMYSHQPAAPGQPAMREAALNGPLDRRMGTTDKSLTCTTCHEPLQTCAGHFGYLKLTLPVFHQGYFKAIIAILSCICKSCSRVLLDPDNYNSALSFMRRVQDDHLRRAAKLRAITEECKKIHICPRCGACNGPIKKIPAGGSRYLMLVHDQYAKHEHQKQDFQSMLTAEDKSFSLTKRNPEMKQAVGKAAQDLDPLTVLDMFQRIPDQDVEVPAPCSHLHC
eukprot:767330-Hanusia_phi.AAC.11